MRGPLVQRRIRLLADTGKGRHAHVEALVAILESEHQLDEQEVHGAVGRLQPVAHEVKGGFAGAEGWYDVDKRDHSAIMIAHSYQGGLVEIGAVEVAQRKPALLVSRQREPFV